MQSFLQLLSTLMLLSLIAACGDGASGDNSSTTDDPPGANDTAGSRQQFAMSLEEYLGSLYRPFSWSGPIRDPERDGVEILDPTQFQPLDSSTVDSLEMLLAERDIIMQIGGMGSAKNPDPNRVNEQFATYMDSIIADGGKLWRDAVYMRGQEVAALDGDHKVYWQIGNEINAGSYLRNINLYFERSNNDLLTIIPVYVEYFLAPTLQALHQVEADTGHPVRIALGSIAGFSNDNSALFLDTLLNYQIIGDYAPALAGARVYEWINLLTIHYSMNASEPDDPDRWRDVLVRSYEQWVGVKDIQGIWTTEEVGIRAAENGHGAGAALRVMVRYLDWISEFQYPGNTARWFYFGTTAGPTNQQINDAMLQVEQILDDSALYYYDHQLNDSATLESYAYRIGDSEGYLLTVSPIGNDNQSIETVAITLPPNTFEAEIAAWRYGNDGTSGATASLISDSSGVQIHLSPAVELSESDTLLIHVDVHP